MLQIQMVLFFIDGREKKDSVSEINKMLSNERWNRLGTREQILKRARAPSPLPPPPQRVLYKVL